MTADKLIPILRDLVSLAGGTYVFVSEALGDARWEPMLLGILFTAGPAAVSAYWSGGRTPASASSGSSPPSSSSSSPSPLPSSPGVDQP